MPDGSSYIRLARRLRTVRQSRLKSSAGKVVRSFDARNIFNIGSMRENTPSETGGTQENAARGRIVAFERDVRPRELQIPS